MKAIAITQKEHVEVIEQPMPVCASNEVLVKVHTSMLCTWEQRVFTQVMPTLLPFVGGHEFAGEIVQIGDSVDASAFPIGSHCAGSYIVSCGICDACKRGDDANCIHKKEGKYLPGKNGLAEYTTLSADNVYLFPDTATMETIMFTEPLACVAAGHNKIDIKLGDEVAIQGAGMMGLLHARLAKLQGARVTILDPDAWRCSNAQNLGVCDFAIKDLPADFSKIAFETVGKRGFDVVINTTAIPASVAQSIALCRPGAAFLMFGKVFPNEAVPIAINAVQDSCIRLVGTMSGGKRAFSQAAKLLGQGTVDPIGMGLLSKMYIPEEAQQAYKAAVDPVTFRIGIRFVEPYNLL